MDSEQIVKRGKGANLLWRYKNSFSVALSGLFHSYQSHHYPVFTKQPERIRMLPVVKTHFTQGVKKCCFSIAGAFFFRYCCFQKPKPHRVGNYNISGNIVTNNISPEVAVLPVYFKPGPAARIHYFDRLTITRQVFQFPFPGEGRRNGPERRVVVMAGRKCHPTKKDKKDHFFHKQNSCSSICEYISRPTASLRFAGIVCRWVFPFYQPPAGRLCKSGYVLQIRYKTGVRV